MLKTNYHTHTTYCDGKNTAEEMILEAIERKFDILGFSSHSMYPFSGSWHIPAKEFEAYTKEIRNLAEKYSAKIKILCGFEADYIPKITRPDFSFYRSLNPDFIIGSVHYIFTERERLAVDYSADRLKAKIEELYSGNAKKMVQDYFSLERKMLAENNFNIIGHADLVRKNNAVLNMFDEKSLWYRKEIAKTADAIQKAGVIAEINTGAIARGTMDDVYPSEEFLWLLNKRNVPVTISSDCHNREFLDAAFDRALDAAKNAGYRETACILENKKVVFQPVS